MDYQTIPCRLQKRDLPKYQGDDDDDEAKEDDDGGQYVEEKKAMTVEFKDKTNQLLDYIEKTYLKVNYPKILNFPPALLFSGHGTGC